MNQLFYYYYIFLFLLLEVSCEDEIPSIFPQDVEDCYYETLTKSFTCDGRQSTKVLPTNFFTQDISRLSIYSYKSPSLNNLEQLLFVTPKVRELYLTRSELVSFPSHINSSALTLLDLSYNSLTEFTFEDSKSLRVLDLSHNKLSVLNIGSIPLLETINLSHNRLHTIQPSTFTVSKIIVNVSVMSLFLYINLIEKLQNMKFLHYINLDSNLLSSLSPNCFSNLPSLAQLILSNNSNSLHSLSNTSIVFPSSLQFLDISYSSLKSIPLPSQVTSLKDFRATNNEFTIITKDSLVSFPDLTLLVLDDNQITSIENGSFSPLTSLTRLWMNNNKLSSLPFPLPPALQSLHIEDNLITHLSPHNFINISSLTDLNLHGNKISTLSPFLFAPLSSSLVFLDLRNNQISSLSTSCFANLSLLTTLDLSLNPIEVIHKGAFDESLSSLNLLRLSRLKLTSVTFDPSSLLSSLSSLEMLQLDGSPALAAPLLRDHGFANCVSLKELQLQNTGLDDLLITAAALMDHLYHLERVFLSGNEWDCSDFLHENHDELEFLVTKRPTLVADNPTCASPPALSGLSFSSAKFRGYSKQKQSSTQVVPYQSESTTPISLYQTTVMETTTSNVQEMNLTSVSSVKEADMSRNAMWSAWKQHSKSNNARNEAHNELKQVYFTMGATFVLILILLLVVGIGLLCYKKLMRYKNSLNLKVRLLLIIIAQWSLIINSFLCSLILILRGRE